MSAAELVRLWAPSSAQGFVAEDTLGHVTQARRAALEDGDTQRMSAAELALAADELAAAELPTDLDSAELARSERGYPVTAESEDAALQAVRDGHLAQNTWQARRAWLTMTAASWGGVCGYMDLAELSSAYRAGFGGSEWDSHCAVTTWWKETRAVDLTQHSEWVPPEGWVLQTLPSSTLPIGRGFIFTPTERKLRARWAAALSAWSALASDYIPASMDTEDWRRDESGELVNMRALPTVDVEVEGYVHFDVTPAGEAIPRRDTADELYQQGLATAPTVGQFGYAVPPPEQGADPVPAARAPAMSAAPWWAEWGTVSDIQRALGFPDWLGAGRLRRLPGLMQPISGQPTSGQRLTVYSPGDA